MAIIQIQDVSKKFQTKDGEIDALKHVTLDIEAGDIYGIIGMSGAGKSTLVRCINHIEVPTEGTVIVQDKDLSKLSEKELRKQREHIGMIFQHFNLLMQKSVLENVCFPLFIRRSEGSCESVSISVIRRTETACGNRKSFSFRSADSSV